MSNKNHAWLKGYPQASVFRVIAPQDGGWSLTPMENLLRGIRGARDVVCLELWGIDGVVCYGARTNNGDSLSGVLHSFFPQARISRREDDETEGGDENDWLWMDDQHQALVQPLYLADDAYLPLRIYDDRTIEQSQMDPLAGLIGLLAGATSTGIGAGKPTGERLGFRMVLRPARPDWNKGWRDMIQRRRDGEDRKQMGGGGRDLGPSPGALALMAVALGIGIGNFLLWEGGHHMAMIPANMGFAALTSLVIYMVRRLGSKVRPYLDEQLLEEKLKSHAFRVETQLIRIYSNEMDEDEAAAGMSNLLNAFRSFEDPVGNSWKVGKVRRFGGYDMVEGSHRHPFLGGTGNLGWLSSSLAGSSILSSREVATIWHPPLGAEEMASMERTAAGTLVPYLSDLAGAGEDSGPLVGSALGTGQDIRLPESAIEKHAIILGRSGVGKSTMVKHVLAHKLKRKADGLDNGAIVVIDPHADLVRDTLKMVPPEIADKVRLLDFGRDDRVPGINLVDPYLFTDRDRCVDTIISTVKHLWEHWGGRLEDLLRRSLMIIYEFNKHEDTQQDEMLTMLDIMKLLDEGKQVGQGRDAKTVMTDWQVFVMSRVVDPRLKEWFTAYLNWPRDTRAEAVGPVHSRIGAYAANQKASVIMGQRKSTILLSDVLSEGLVLLVSTASGTVGEGPAALMGGTMVSLVESALRDQEKLATAKRSKCLVVCDEFQTVTGANWEGLLAEGRKYGLSLMLATQSLARLDSPERKLKAGILGNVGCIVGYQMSAEDSRIISAEMDDERVEPRYLVNLDPHHCYVRINSSKTCYPAFSMRTKPPPDIMIDPDIAARSEASVLAASVAYTVDWHDARQKMIDELNESMAEGKLDVKPEVQPEVKSVDRGPAADSPRSSPEARVAQEHSRQGSANPFDTAKRHLETKGSLRGIPKGYIADSAMSRDMQEKLAQVDRKDPALKAILDKHLGDRLKAERGAMEKRIRSELESPVGRKEPVGVGGAVRSAGNERRPDVGGGGVGVEEGFAVEDEDVGVDPLFADLLGEEGALRDPSMVNRLSHLGGSTS